MSYSMKVENFGDLQACRQNESQQSPALLYCSECCLANCMAVQKNEF